MKNYALGLLVLSFSLTSFSVEPNRYSCEGEGMKAYFSTTSKTGQPMLMIASSDESDPKYHNKFSSTDVPMGKMLGVYSGSIPDVSYSELVLTIPGINLLATRADVPGVIFETTISNVTHVTSIGGPGLIHGVLDKISAVYKVKCSADHELF